MADVKFAIKRGTLSANIGDPDRDFTETGFGTPKAAIVFFSEANSTYNPMPNSTFSIGFWDSTNNFSRSVYGGSESAVETAEANRGDSNTVIGKAKYRATVQSTYTIASTTDGVTITTTVDNDDIYRYATVILIGGTDVQAEAHVVTPAASASSVTVTGLSFRPRLLLFATSGLGSNQEGTQYIITLGAAVSQNGIINKAVSWYAADAGASSNTGTWVSSNYCAAQYFANTVNWACNVTAITGDGFVLETYSGSTGGDVVKYLALDFGGYNANIQEIATPTSTGLDRTSGLGFKPSHLLAFLGRAVNKNASNDNASVSVGISDGTTESSVAVHEQDGVGTMNAGSISQEKLIDMRQVGTSGELVAATVDHFDSDGYTLDYTVVGGSTYYGFTIALQTEENKRVISTANGFLGMTGG